LALLVILALMVFGCSKKEDQAVAKVGERTITVAQLNARIEGVTYTSWDDELKKRTDILNGLIDNQLIVLTALDEGYDQDPEFDKNLKNSERNAILELMYKKEILEKSTPSEKEIQAIYDMMGWEIKARHILVKTEAEAQEIYQQVIDGADFAKLAEEKSTDPASKSKGGDLGYFSWGKMVAPFQDTVFAMEIGEISKPINSRFGWHIVKVEDRRTKDRSPYEEESGRIEQRLTSEKSKQLSEEYVAKLKDEANIELDPEATQTLLNGFMSKKTSRGDFSEEDLQRTLVSFKGGSWTISDFLTEFESIPPMYHPRVKDTDDIDALVKNLLTGLLLEERARKMGLHKDREVVLKIQNERENALMRTYQQKGMPKDTILTTDQIETYYEENIDQYSTLAQAHVWEVQLDTEEEARDVLKRLKGGANFAKLAKEKSTREWAAKKGGDLGWLDKRRYPAISGAALEMKVGELGGPIQDGPKFSVIKVQGKKASEPKPLDEVRESIKRVLLREREVELTKKWLQEKRETIGVEIYEDVLQSTMTSPKEEAVPEEAAETEEDAA
jgi:peptidyl-prolyl cis-trans isomerase C